MTKDEIVDVLRKLRLFKNFTLDELNIFSTVANSVLKVRKDDVVFEKGDVGDNMMIILSGSVNIIFRDGNKKKEILLTTGTVVGEMSVVDEQPRSADVVANEKCLLLFVSKLHCDLLSQQYPLIALKFYKELAKVLSMRLRNRNPARVGV
ncbi:MAG: cyclic nucleotide-binding domain-containing protein [Methylococcales bacterium]|jgi:CRP/FNR family transcriptional regulator, cyclic AMP receptor protein|nr:cyclic nucleotide-binding domain-containing protein [Methylococcales bacterium]